MAEPLRPLRVRLADPASAGHLLAFLRGRGCVVDQIGSNTFDVWPPPLLHERGASLARPGETLDLAVGEVACTVCGLAIAPALSRLGSPRCHDCRDDGDRPPGNSNGRYQAELARVELRAYLRAWRAETGGAAAALDG
ncbi:MAG: hypothetical protein ICV59_05980 [Thermoleophilia bacterium]|nr:hypothetical protein [Thermoleophilia bacterium]